MMHLRRGAFEYKATGVIGRTTQVPDGGFTLPGTHIQASLTDGVMAGILLRTSFLLKLFLRLPCVSSHGISLDKSLTSIYCTSLQVEKMKLKTTTTILSLSVFGNFNDQPD